MPELIEKFSNQPALISWTAVARAAKRFGLRVSYDRDHGPRLRRPGTDIEICAAQLLFWVDRGDEEWSIMRMLANNWAITPEVYADHVSRHAVADLYGMPRGLALP